MAEHISQIENIDTHLDYQVIVIGAGVAGIYQIKRLADLGVRARRCWTVIPIWAALVQQPLPRCSI